jgi:hypothetical protein
VSRIIACAANDIHDVEAKPTLSRLKTLKLHFSPGGAAGGGGTALLDLEERRKERDHTLLTYNSEWCIINSFQMRHFLFTSRLRQLKCVCKFIIQILDGLKIV